MKKLNLFALLLISATLLLSSCADSKTFTINGEKVTVQPYGPADEDVLKNENVVYQVCVGNVILDVIFCESIFVPVWLIGWQLYEPVALKKEAITTKE